MAPETDLQKLIELLDEAKRLAAQFSSGYSGRFSSAEEFHSALKDSIAKLKAGDASQLEKLHLWFLPTSCWDDFVGKEGQSLANDISNLLTKMRNERL